MSELEEFWSEGNGPLPQAKREELFVDQWGCEFVYRRIKNASVEKYIAYSKGPNRKDEYGMGDDICIPPLESEELATEQLR